MQQKRRSPAELLDWEHGEIRKDVESLVASPEDWLSMPNDQLGGSSPGELIGTPEEPRLRNLLRSIYYGVPT